MSGTGKYSQYTAPTIVDGKDVTKKESRLRKIFSDKYSDKSKVPPHLTVDPGKEKEAREAVVELAKQLLTPSVQTGDPLQFPGGVSLDFNAAPNLDDVKWKNPGDPANPYTPDITSPGVNSLLGTDKKSDPEISASDINPNYKSETGTASPKSTSQKITENSTLGKDGKLGSSS